MRVHSHDVHDARELCPMNNRVKPDDASLMYQAAAAGRTDVLGPVGLLGLQRVTGNAAVQRLVGSSSTTPLAVQRYRVGARQTASCEQVIDQMDGRLRHHRQRARLPANHFQSSSDPRQKGRHARVDSARTGTCRRLVHNDYTTTCT
jgi:hypothetical protein